jgi:hypothetical protein
MNQLPFYPNLMPLSQKNNIKIAFFFSCIFFGFFSLKKTPAKNTRQASYFALFFNNPLLKPPRAFPRVGVTRMGERPGSCLPVSASPALNPRTPRAASHTRRACASTATAGGAPRANTACGLEPPNPHRRGKGVYKSPQAREGPGRASDRGSGTPAAACSRGTPAPSTVCASCPPKIAPAR